MTDFRGVLQTLVEVEPDEIYNLAGQSSVGLSFQQPVETLESIAHATLTLLEAIRFLRKPLRLYNAASGECFGETSSSAPATEQSQFKPRSPYGVAKAAAFWEVANYREAYGVFACSGILFNHESALRPARFVTQKVVQAAVRIASGEQLRLKLGQLSVIRDWGWAPEYVDAMWRMLQQDEARDFVIATGKSRRLEEFISLVFGAVNLDWRDHVDIDPNLFRASDIAENYADPSLAHRELGWSAELGLEEIASRLVAAEQGVV
jgi:GDPmannose 4,6-dehydratase